MPIPDFQTIMLPLLQMAADGKEHKLHDAVDQLAKQFSLTEEEKSKKISTKWNPADIFQPSQLGQNLS